jgi:hypothetical protein
MKKILHRIFFNFDDQMDPFAAYLKTWQEQLPDFQILHWDKTNLPLDLNPFTRYMAEKKQHAFLSDYFRCWLLHRYGGFYLDADIEILKGETFRRVYEEAQDAGDYALFLGIESDKTGGLTPHSMGIKCGEKHEVLSFLMDLYETAFTTAMRYTIKKFPIPDLISLYFVELEKEHGYGLSKNGCFYHCTEPFITRGIKIYPQEYFSPVTSNNRDMMVAAFGENTCLCHHFAATWKDPGNAVRGELFAERLAANYYVVPPSVVPALRKRYPALRPPRRPSWSLNTGEIAALEGILNRAAPYGGLWYGLLKKLRRRDR